VEEDNEDSRTADQVEDDIVNKMLMFNKMKVYNILVYMASNLIQDFAFQLINFIPISHSDLIIRKVICPREKGKIKKDTCADLEIRDGVLTTQPYLVLTQ
jgi:hypothetical protein